MSNDTTNETTNEIPYGYCRCGCGQKTRIAKSTHEDLGITKGEPLPYVRKHRLRPVNQPPVNPTGLCMCGCGQSAPVAKYSSITRGWIVGQPVRFISGHGKRKSLADKFWEKVEIGEGSDCWLWKAGKNANGYGTLSSRKGGSALAHRISWELHFGAIPDGMNVLHNCPDGDNPGCVNPSHLWLGTMADNSQDMVAKGRMNHTNRVMGEAVHTSRLTPDDVREIRRLYSDGAPIRRLARQWGIGQKSAQAIVYRKSWKHIE